MKIDFSAVIKDLEGDAVKDGGRTHHPAKSGCLLRPSSEKCVDRTATVADDAPV